MNTTKSSSSSSSRKRRGSWLFKKRVRVFLFLILFICYFVNAFYISNNRNLEVEKSMKRVNSHYAKVDHLKVIAGRFARKVYDNSNNNNDI